MNIKKFPYWLRGGIVSVACCLIIIILALTIDLTSGNLFDWFLIMALSPYGFAAMWFGGTANLIIGFLQQSLVYFIIGSFLGFIYGKLKS